MFVDDNLPGMCGVNRRDLVGDEAVGVRNYSHSGSHDIKGARAVPDISRPKDGSGSPAISCQFRDRGPRMEIDSPESAACDTGNFWRLGSFSVVKCRCDRRGSYAPRS